ncbi:MAG: protein phosphatase 2C domain-containing protein [Dysosmobacter sp.]|nr:protein phosphatase 2C domain-containing protein [Dysosmobacter sp.]
MADGKEASQSAVEDLLARFRDCGPDTDIPAWLDESVHAVSREVFRRFSGASGTTLAAVHLRGSALHWVSVGDSAIFLLRDGGVFQLNREHTFLNTLYARELEQDVICRERAEQDEDAHRLTSFVGIDRLEEVDRSLRPLALLPGDALLLCSDGVSGVLTPPELMEAMALRPEEGCALLEQMVLEKDLPAQDNFTGILISCK